MPLAARLAEAVVCRDLSDDDAPIDPTEVFSDDDDFHVSIKYFDLKEGQSIGVEWFFEDELWRESSITVDAANAGDGYAVFSLTNSELWPEGSYHVDVYLDDEFARQSKYGGIVAPPTYIFDVSHDIFAEIGEEGRDLTRVTVPGMNAVRGGNEYEFCEPVKPGDVVNRWRKVIDIYEKEGKKAGKILFITYETTYVNQSGTVLGKCRETMMFLK